MRNFRGSQKPVRLDSGLAKAEQHARFPRRNRFCRMLCDLCLINAPQISIHRRRYRHGGQRPAGGTLKKVGVVLASVNPFASDLAAAHLMGYEPEEVGTVRAAVKRGLCPKTAAELTLDGEPLDRFASRFRRPDASAGGLVKQIPTIFGGRFAAVACTAAARQPCEMHRVWGVYAELSGIDH